MQMEFSVVVPVYADGHLAEAFCQQFRSVLLAGLLPARSEVIFVNDASPDDSARLLEKVAETYGFVRVLRLEKNIGQHAAILAGFAASRGARVAMMDIDQEVPVSALPAFWASPADVAIGARITPRPMAEELTSRALFGVLRWLAAPVPLSYPARPATVRAMSRSFMQEVLRSAGQLPSGLPVFIPSVELAVLKQHPGFSFCSVPVAQQPSLKPTSAYTFRKRWKMGMGAVRCLLHLLKINRKSLSSNP